MSFDSKSPLSFELPGHWLSGHWRQEVRERFITACRRLEILMRHLAEASEEEIPIEWETVEWIGGPFDGMQRRVEGWKLFNLPAHLEIPVHPATFDYVDGGDAEFDNASATEIQCSAPLAVYVSTVQGASFRYRYLGMHRCS